MTKSETVTVQDKIAKLSELVAWFDGEEFELEKAIEMYKKAETLAGEIEKDLMRLQNDIQVVKESFA